MFSHKQKSRKKKFSGFMHGSKNNLSIKKIQIEGSFRTVLEDLKDKQKSKRRNNK
jgi:hypothetical protein